MYFAIPRIASQGGGLEDSRAFITVLEYLVLNGVMEKSFVDFVAPKLPLDFYVWSIQRLAMQCTSLRLSRFSNSSVPWFLEPQVIEGAC